MEGVIREVSKGVSAFIESPTGEHYGHKSQFVFTRGHRCIQRGMELDFVTKPNPYRSNQGLASCIRIVNWTYPSKQIVAKARKWNGRFGHVELECGCPVLLLKKNFLTLDHFINMHMKVGAQIVFDVEETAREGTEVVSLMAVNVEIIDTNGQGEANGNDVQVM